MRRRFMLSASVLALVLAAGPLWSQDSHYWTEQFGNRSRLLGGSVIGGGSDISVVYYNPGALALMANPEILLAGNVFEVRNVSADPASPDVKGASSTSLSLSPSLFAGQLRNEVLGGQFAYSFLTRSRADFRLAVQSSLPTDEVELPNISFASNNTLVEQALGDYWFGGTWSRAFGERIGLGVSTFFALRSQTTRFQDTVTVLAEDNRAAASSEIRDFSFYNVRLLWKIGLATDWERWKLGFTITTPSVSLFGNGTSTVDSSLVAQAVDSSGNPLTFVASDQQTVSAEYRSPLSIGFGASRSFGATRLYLSGEWFQSIGPYAILDTEPFQSQSSGETLTSDIVHELGSITNFAIGIEHALSAGRRLYGSFWTDFNAVEEESVANVSGSPFDLYHFGGGYSFLVGSSDVTLGAVVALGSAETSLNLKPPALGSGMVDTSYLRVTFIFGFNFALATGG